MQTFLPYPDFVKSAEVLDMKRLGKQRVEAMQIANCIANGRTTGWANHPAVKMWDGYLDALIDYGVAICKEWRSIGYKDTCMDKLLVLRSNNPAIYPDWLGDDRLHSSHRSKLLFKKPEHYMQFGWSEPNNLPYFWPVNQDI